MKVKVESLKNIKTIQFIGSIIFIIVLYVSSIYSNTYFSWWYLVLLIDPIFNYLRRTNKIDFIVQKKWFIKSELYLDQHPYLYKSFLVLILFLIILIFILFK